LRRYPVASLAQTMQTSRSLPCAASSVRTMVVANVRASTSTDDGSVEPR